CKRFGARVGLSGEAVRDRLLEQGFRGILARLEAGELAPTDFASTVSAGVGLSLPFSEFVRDWEDMFWLNQPVSPVIASLKSRGHKLVLGSNTNEMHATHYRRKFADTLGQFDAFVLSYEVGCLKPDLRFYETCARAAGVAPESCLFIDDIADNVAGARKAGLKGLHYVDDLSLIEGLRSFGI